MGRFGTIYIITNNINKKVYIGQTVGSLKKRFLKHCNDKTNTAIHKAIVKYGRENFEILELDTADNRKELDEKEMYYIKTMKSQSPHGYNIAIGGGGISGHKFTKESRERLSKAHLGYIMPQETKDKISRSNQHKKTEEHRRNISKGLKLAYKDKVFSDEELRKRSEAQKGKTKSKETRDKMSLARKGKKLTEEEFLKYRQRVDKKLKKVKNVTTGELFDNVNLAGEQFENKKSAIKGIRRVCAGQRKTYGGFEWEYFSSYCTN